MIKQNSFDNLGTFEFNAQSRRAIISSARPDKQTRVGTTWFVQLVQLASNAVFSSFWSVGQFFFASNRNRDVDIIDPVDLEMMMMMGDAQSVPQPQPVLNQTAQAPPPPQQQNNQHQPVNNTAQQVVQSGSAGGKWSTGLRSKSNPITEDYKISKNVLGVGINGKVVECMNKKSGEKFALKVCFYNQRRLVQNSVKWF